MKIKRLSVKLSLYLMGLLILSVAIVAAYIVKTQTDMFTDMTLSEFKTATLVASKAYQAALEKAVDMKEITLDEILHPKYETMVFTDDQGRPLTLEDPRYHTKLADIAGRSGIREFQNEIVNRGAIFATGMSIEAYVAVPNDIVNNPPHGVADLKYDRKYSRQFRIYKEDEPRKAVQFVGGPQLTEVLEYPRDTGELAWDVIAPIYVKGEHFGAFRIGVSRDKLNQRNKTLILGLVLMFGILVASATAFTFLVSWYHIKPLKLLSVRIDGLSMTDDMKVLCTRIVSTDSTEIGTMAKSVERLRKSLEHAMTRLLHFETVHPYRSSITPQSEVTSTSITLRGK